MNLNSYKERREREINRNLELMEQGVIFRDIERAYIDEDVTIGEGTFIDCSVVIEKGSVIGKNCKIFQNTKISNGKIGDDVTIESSVILDSSVGNGTSVGPFAYIRPGSSVGDNCKVGDFVELKNATLGNGTKSAHLTYIGDADVGENVNFGCGVVFVNYDGTNKYRSTVGNDVFIGCNSNLVSPVKVGDGAYVAAGTTITEDVPENSLAIGRSKQIVKEGWASERQLYRRKK